MSILIRRHDPEVHCSVIGIGEELPADEVQAMGRVLTAGVDHAISKEATDRAQDAVQHLIDVDPEAKATVVVEEIPHAA